MNKASDRPDRRKSPPPGTGEADLPYIVELRPQFDPEERLVLARVDSRAVAEAAFQAAVEARPGAEVVLRQGEQVLRASRPAAR